MTEATGEIRREVIACLAASSDCNDADIFAKFGPIEEETELASLVQSVAELSEEERVSHVTDQLRSFAAREEFSGLAEIHPAWLVEVLAVESPRIIGIILRYLPSKQVRYIIEHLPRRIKQRLPQLIDSFAVPAPILKIIKARFEKKFISQYGSRDFETFEFENIPYLKSTDLITVLKDIGIHELAMALKGVERSSLNILFNRLSVQDARTLQQRIRSLTDVSPVLLKEAKYTILEMSLSEMDSEDLLLDIGLNAFSRSITHEDKEILPILKQKIEPRLGYTLKRYIDQHVNSNLADVCHKRKELALLRIEALARAGSIDESLVDLFEIKKSMEEKGDVSNKTYEDTASDDEQKLSPDAESITESDQESATESESWHTEERVV